MILQRLLLLESQLEDTFSYKDFMRLRKKIKTLSKRWGVAVRENCLDGRTEDLTAFAYHPVSRFLNSRDKLIYQKMKDFRELTDYDQMNSQSKVLKLKSYSLIEFIPANNLDQFFTDTNKLKFVNKISVMSKSIKELMSLSET
jgi:uncharacterized protein YlbG (UPF0298 family)